MKVNNKSYEEIAFKKQSPYEVNYLKVSNIHTIYYELSGNKNGKPVLLIHGGPGSGISNNHFKFFNPKLYNIVAFDQRGCGKSTPLGCIKENTTHDLINDIELLRIHLNIELFYIVFGGSWGSTLALTYAIKKPCSLEKLIVYSIFLCREQELNYIYKPNINVLKHQQSKDAIISKSMGIYMFYPLEFKKFKQSLINFIKEYNVKNINNSYVVDTNIDINLINNNILEYYYYILCNLGYDYNDFTKQSNYKKALDLCKEWCLFELILCSIYPNENISKEIYNSNKEEELFVCARLESHYFYNKGFFDCDDYIVKNAHKLNHLNAVEIIHSRYDMLCPFINAYDLNQSISNSNLTVSCISGHSCTDEDMFINIFNVVKKHNYN